MKTLFISLLALTLLFACDDASDNPCDGQTCDNHGTCKLDSSNTPYCDCEPNYVWEIDDNLTCVIEMVDDKPVIYLYPQKATKVTVSFGDPESVELLHTYPSYGETGWCVTAHPDGTLFDCKTGVEFYALFWEGITPDAFGLKKGFVVPGSDTIAFLEEKLPQLGLNRREANEFIMFWLPLLEGNPYNFIHFAQKEWTDSVPLSVQPEPDTTIRFIMLYSPLETAIDMEPQQFDTLKEKDLYLLNGAEELFP